MKHVIFELFEIFFKISHQNWKKKVFYGIGRALAALLSINVRPYGTKCHQVSILHFLALIPYIYHFMSPNSSKLFYTRFLKNIFEVLLTQTLNLVI